MIGSSVSHYRVTSKLGEGGMGEVWRAEDTKLGRAVALKMLPEVFAQDPERLARFEREARVLASLSHPNIAGIHGLENVDGKRFLVMELVEGQSLAERIQQGPMAVDEAVRIAKQIAEAVEAAHEKGVVHRDLKPANVNLTPDGTIKVLDFGLAKALIGDPMSGDNVKQDLSLSPTLTQAMTGLGVLLGTAGYMSPEQARGKPVDRRADIWAFGCILYEMLTGQRLFTGETATDVIGAVVHKEPDLDELSAKVPVQVRRLLERCLQKDVNRRLQSIGDARIALQEWLENPDVEEVATETAPQGWRRWTPWAVAAGALVFALLVMLGPLGGRGAAPEPVRRSSIQIGDDGLFSGFGASAVLSPDGRLLAYVTGSGNEGGAILLRPLDRFEPTVIATGGAGNAPYHPFFSPDGEWMGFVTPAELKKVSTAGGAPITLCKVDLNRGASWGEDQTIVYAPSPRSGLLRMSAAGGESEPLTTLGEGEISHRWPQWLPGGKAVLFTSIGEDAPNFEDASLEVVTVATGERKVVHRGGYYGRYVETGHILYVQEDTVFALPFDVTKLESRGSQMPVLEGVGATVVQGAAQFDVSKNGVLVYAPTSREGDPFPVVWVDRTGRSEPLWSEPALYANPELSPDGRKLAVSMLRGNNWDIWVFDLERKVATRLTFDEAYDADQIWSPDGRYIAFSSNRMGGNNAIYRKAADGSGEAELILEPGAELSGLYPTSWSPDGKWIAVWASNSDIYVVPADGGEAQPYQTTDFGEFNPSFSPDSRWIAYDSSESGRLEIYVRGFPAAGGKWQVSDGGGALARWSADGRELFYRTDDGLMAVDVDGSGSTFEVGTPHQLFTGSFLGGTNGIAVGGFVFPDYTVTRDGQRFVMFAGREETSRPTSVRLVTNWFEELRRLTSVGGR
jgi:Tol biopolymer transport system component